MGSRFGELSEDADWLIKASTFMKKKYDEQCKIIKQNPMHEEHIFMDHVIMKKQYIVSFVQPFQGHLEEMNFEETERFVNPNQFKNGVLVISKYPSLTNANGHSHLNGTDSFSNDEVFNDTQQQIFPSTELINIPRQTSEYIRCGTLFTASEVFALGKKDFHGSLGSFKKTKLSLSALEPLSISESRYISAVVSQASNINFSLLEKKTTIICCEPSKPTFIRMILLCPETLSGKNFLRIFQIKDDDGRAAKKARARFDEGSYTASYDILKGLVSDNNNTTNDVTTLKAVFCWPTSRNQMDALPPHSSKSVLQVQVALGEQQSPLNEIFLELTSLDSIANSSVNELSNSDGTQSFEMDRLYENLSSFKETVSNFSFYGGNSGGVEHEEKADEDNEDLEKPMSQLIRQSFHRNDHDFTDKLWLFLRNSVGGFQEMKFYLDDILNDIVHGSVQPAVSPMNSTKLAKLVRKMYTEEQDDAKMHTKEKLLEFLSNDAALVNLIVEIGFEKMRKDYYHYFLTNELAVLPLLDKMRGKQPLSSHHSHNINDISFLWKLHCCLEVVITPTVYLRLDHDSQRSLLNASLEYYAQCNVTSCSPIFCLSLLPVYDTLSNVLNSCTTRLPDIWKEGILRINKTGMREVCITCQENENSVMEDDDVTTSSISSKDEKFKNKVGLVLCESVVELPK